VFEALGWTFVAIAATSGLLLGLCVLHDVSGS